MNHKERSDKIREIMDLLDLTIPDLAKRSEVHINTIGNALNGGKGLRVDTLIAIAQGLGVPPYKLI
jgi:transcriptional regulator with XRE-family HTH domain